jgi:hypothetical protein
MHPLPVPLSFMMPPFPLLTPPASRLPCISGRQSSNQQRRSSDRRYCCRGELCPSQAPDRRDAILLPCCFVPTPPLRLRSVKLQSTTAELQSPPPHDLVAGSSNRRRPKPQIDATPSHSPATSCSRPSAMDTAARGSSATGEGGLSALLRPPVLPLPRISRCFFSGEAIVSSSSCACRRLLRLPARGKPSPSRAANAFEESPLSSIGNLPPALPSLLEAFPNMHSVV